MTTMDSKLHPELDALINSMRKLEVEAEELHHQAQDLNKKREFAASQQKYKEFRARDDEAISLALRIGQMKEELGLLDTTQENATTFAAEVHPYSTVPGIADVETYRLRCQGAILGAVVGDAAATSVQWVYDPDQLDVFACKQKAKGIDGLEFMDPPANAHFEYAVGRNSPYGEQALLLLQALAEHEQLDTYRYAQLFADTFGGNWHVDSNGYRDASCKGFLRNWALGLKPPHSGAHDKQINCCTRLAPLLAMYAGHPELDQVVEQCTRVTQNTQAAVAWATLGTRVLEKILLGQLPTQATKDAVDELWNQQDDDKLTEEAAEELYIVAGYLHRVQGLSHWAPVKQAIANLGKNCHTPNSYQTPVHAVLRTLTAYQSELEQADPLPLATGQAIFESCVRQAMREGGCCASRCGVIGALLGAYLAGRCRTVDGFIPKSWRGRSLAFERAKVWAKRIDELRMR
eukprot:TRINITY_DN1630_c0_g1_i2.p1 TRINITY_DN1630_c0_g1~~TRINITY_DN1630_c0_g1_i2.p1  ORF type:complete len:461 (+),score=112.89 TRINITY_DN1630_c0_g1_i2:89-1471(+)